MFRFTVILGLIFFSTTLSAQRSEERPVSEFDEVSVLGNINLYLIHGEENHVKVEARGTSPDNILVDVKNYRLKIRTRTKAFSNAELNVYVTYEKLHLIKAGAGSRVHSDYIVKGRALDLSVGSGAQMDLEVKTPSLKLRTGEGGILKVEGTADYAEATVNTGGQLEADELESAEMYIKVHTGGMAHVYAEEVLNASVGTGGELRYSGSPERKHIRTSLGGSVSKSH